VGILAWWRSGEHRGGFNLVGDKLGRASHSGADHHRDGEVDGEVTLGDRAWVGCMVTVGSW
jgi:acetyltransferase-like isoleucine patch superfamily enzyme